jgi:hypothetical protein
VWLVVAVVFVAIVVDSVGVDVDVVAVTDGVGIDVGPVTDGVVPLGVGPVHDPHVDGVDDCVVWVVLVVCSVTECFNLSQCNCPL